MFGYKQEFSPASITEDYFLEGQKSMFSVVIPEATENLVINPSPVLNTTGYSAMAGAIASSTTRQRRGPNSIRVAPTGATTDGAYYGTVTTVTGWNTFSLDFWGYPGVPYKIYFATTGAALLGTAVEFVGEGMWRRPEVKLYEAAGTTRRVYFTKNGSADTNYFYVDGLQVEAKDHSTTFCMGDMIGFVPGQTAYYWTGNVYASTSIRIQDTASGGRIVPLSNYGFRLMAYTGLGISEAANISFPYARIDGENYQTTRMTGRDFSLIGEISGSSFSELLSNKSNLSDALHPNRTATRQQLLLLYKYIDEYGNEPYEDTYIIRCSYVDGLRGSTTNKTTERIGINFRSSEQEIFLDGLLSSSLNYFTDIPSKVTLAKVNNVWQAIGSWDDPAPSITGIAVDKNYSRVWYSGGFVRGGQPGVTANNVGYWDIQSRTFVSIGGATKGVSGGAIYCFVIMPNGDVWMLGEFTAAGGATTKGLARWNSASDTFTVFNLTGTVTGFYAGVADKDQNLYLFGNFTNWNGVAGNAYAVKYTAAGAWESLGTVPYGSTEYPHFGKGISIDALGNIIIGSEGSSGAAGHLRKLNGTTWTDLGATNANGIIRAVFADFDGSYYFGGLLTSLAGISMSNIGRYSNGLISPLSSGLTDFGGTTGVQSIIRAYDGLLISGYFLIPGSYSPVDEGMCLYNGSSFCQLDAKFQHTGNVYADVFGNDIYLAYEGGAASDGYVAGLTTVVSDIKKGTYPNIYIKGPAAAGTYGYLRWLENQTTKQRVYLNVRISSGEMITLSFTSGKCVVYSSFYGPITSQPMPGSSPGFFWLQQGNNVISLFVLTSSAGVTMTWNRFKNSLG